jgi:hypothetical protein
MLKHILSNIRTLSLPLTLWCVACIFTVLYSWGVHHVLLRGVPQIGTLPLPASTANYAVSLLSQVFSTLVDELVKSALDAFRWELAARKQGVSFPTFFQLSGATDLFSVFRFVYASRGRSPLGVLR